MSEGTHGAHHEAPKASSGGGILGKIKGKATEYRNKGLATARSIGTPDAKNEGSVLGNLSAAGSDIVEGGIENPWGQLNDLSSTLKDNAGASRKALRKVFGKISRPDQMIFNAGKFAVALPNEIVHGAAHAVGRVVETGENMALSAINGVEHVVHATREAADALNIIPIAGPIAKLGVEIATGTVVAGLKALKLPFKLIRGTREGVGKVKDGIHDKIRHATVDGGGGGAHPKPDAHHPAPAHPPGHN